MQHFARLALVAAALALFTARPAQAEGLRLSASFAAVRYGYGEGPANLLVTNLTGRVSRGRAGLALTVPVLGISGGSFAGDGEGLAVSPASEPEEKGFRGGGGDWSVGLDYNLVQNRERMIIVTLGGFSRFANGKPGVSIGEQIFGLNLSGVYGITRKLLAFADLRSSYAGWLMPNKERARAADLGAVYWLTDGFGVTAGVSAAKYLLKDDQPASFDFNAGILVEALPGMMVNLGGLGGVYDGASQFGGTAGIGYEL